MVVGVDLKDQIISELLAIIRKHYHHAIHMNTPKRGHQLVDIVPTQLMESSPETYGEASQNVFSSFPPHQLSIQCESPIISAHILRAAKLLVQPKQRRKGGASLTFGRDAVTHVAGELWRNPSRTKTMLVEMCRTAEAKEESMIPLGPRYLKCTQTGCSFSVLHPLLSILICAFTMS